MIHPRAQLREGCNLRDLRFRFPWYRVPQSRGELAAQLGIPAHPTNGISHVWTFSPPGVDLGIVSPAGPCVCDTNFDQSAILLPRVGAGKPRYDPRNFGRSVEVGGRFLSGEARAFSLAAAATFPLTTDQGWIVWGYYPGTGGLSGMMGKGGGNPSGQGRLSAARLPLIRYVDDAGVAVVSTAASGSVDNRLLPIWYGFGTGTAARISVASIDRNGSAVANGAAVVNALSAGASEWSIGAAIGSVTSPDWICLAVARIVGAASVQADDGLAMMRRLWPWRTQDTA